MGVVIDFFEKKMDFKQNLYPGVPIFFLVPEFFFNFSMEGPDPLNFMSGSQVYFEEE